MLVCLRYSLETSERGDKWSFSDAMRTGLKRLQEWGFARQDGVGGGSEGIL